MFMYKKNKSLFRKKKKEEPKAKEATLAVDEVIDYVISLVTRRGAIQPQLDKIEKIKEFPMEKRESDYIDVYLELERFLIEREPIKKYTKEGLRAEIRKRFKIKRPANKFEVLCLEEWKQRVELIGLMSRLFSKKLISLLGIAYFHEIVDSSTKGTILEGIRIEEEKVEWDIAEREISELSEEERIGKLTHAFSVLISALFDKTKKGFGEERAKKNIEDAYNTVKGKYDFLPIASEIIRVIPDGVLEKEKLAFLSKEELERKVEERTKELKKKTRDLEKAIGELMGSRASLLNMMNDMTETKKELEKAYKELERSNELKDLFTDIMRHDLLNPIGIVKTYSELVEREENFHCGFLLDL